MIELEQQLRQVFEEGIEYGFWDWELLEEVKRLHRFNNLGEKIAKLAK